MDRSGLESRVAGCASLDDFLALAAEAAGEAGGGDFAREVLHRAELHCQMPLDYIRTAGEAVTRTGDLDFARELYEQAEELLFDAGELSAWAYGVGVHLGEKDKAREALERAREQAGGPEDQEEIRRVEQALASGGAPGSPDAPGESGVRSLDEALAAAEGLKDEDPEGAREALGQGAGHCRDAVARVRYAAGIRRLFGDREWARRVLREAEAQCRSAGEFVALAEGFESLLGDAAEGAALLVRAAPSCPGGEERLALAEACWRLGAERALAREACRLALAELDDRERLLAVAARAAGELASPDLARIAYGKAAARTPRAADLVALGERVLAEAGDREQAVELFERAAAGLDAPRELARLGTLLLDAVGERGRARAVFGKALEAAREPGELLALVAPLRQGLGDEAPVRQALERALAGARGVAHLVEVAEAAAAHCADGDFTGRALAGAEERITRLAEARAVAEAARRLLPGDREREARLRDLVARREAHEAVYARMQAAEQGATGALDLLRLAGAVKRELDDAGYVRRLLDAAERRIMQGPGPDPSLCRALALAVHRHLGDGPWLARLLDAEAARCESFASVFSVAEQAATAFGAAGPGHARRCLGAFRARLEAREDPELWEYAKLAEGTGRLLGDREEALGLLRRAAAAGGDRFAFAHLASLARDFGAGDLAEALRDRAFDACANATELVQLARRLREEGMPARSLRARYAAAGTRLAAPHERLVWIEGIADVLGEREWARAEYEAALATPDAAERARVAASRRARTPSSLY